LLVVRGLLN